jgi:hypothetical protein
MTIKGREFQSVSIVFNRVRGMLDHPNKIIILLLIGFTISLTILSDGPFDNLEYVMMLALGSFVWGLFAAFVIFFVIFPAAAADALGIVVLKLIFRSPNAENVFHRTAHLLISWPLFVGVFLVFSIFAFGIFPGGEDCAMGYRKAC